MSKLASAQDSYELSSVNNWVGYLHWLGVEVEEPKYRQSIEREKN